MMISVQDMKKVFLWLFLAWLIKSTQELNFLLQIRHTEKQTKNQLQ